MMGYDTVVTYHRCSDFHEWSVETPIAQDTPTTSSCPDCGQEAGWFRSVMTKLHRGSDHRLTHQCGEQSENKAEQAFLNVKNTIKEAGEHSMRTAHQWTEKQSADWRELERRTSEKNRSMHRRGDKEMNFVGSIPAKLERARIQQSGDPEYWTRDNYKNMKREGLYLGRK